MKQSEFLKELEKALSALPEQDRQEILSEQREHFEAARAEGRTDEEIARGLGEPSQLAQAYRVQARMDRAERAEGLKDQGTQITHAIFALLVLAPVNLIFVLGPYIGLLGVLFGAWALVFSGAVAGLAVAVQALFAAQPILFKFSAFFGALGVVSGSVAFAVLMFWVTEFCFKATLAYLKWNLKMVSGK
jgi:uncharacterized membrane protein